MLAPVRHVVLSSSDDSVCFLQRMARGHETKQQKVKSQFVMKTHWTPLLKGSAESGAGFDALGRPEKSGRPYLVQNALRAPLF